MFSPTLLAGTRDESFGFTCRGFAELIQIGSPALVFECPLWVKSGHSATSERCPLYPRKRTSKPAPLSASTQQLRQLGDIRRDPPDAMHPGAQASLKIRSFSSGNL